MRRLTLICFLCFAGAAPGWFVSESASKSIVSAEESRIGQVAPNRYITSTGQVLTPAGLQVELPGMRPQILALSPDGTLLAVAGGNNSLVLLNPATDKVIQKIHLSLIEIKIKPPATISKTNSAGEVTSEIKTNSGPTTVTVTNTAEISLTGLVFSPAGDRVYLSNAGGNIWAFPVTESHLLGPPTILSVPHANAPKQGREIPCGLAVSSDGTRLYVTGNLGNRLYELEAATGKLLRTWKTGVAPFDVVLVGNKVYVSNLGGTRPEKGDLTAPAGKGKTVRVDPSSYIANEGSVVIVDLTGDKDVSEILVGLHPSALAVSPSRRYVVVANSGSDTLNVLDTRTDQIVEKIWARQNPGDLFGAQPDALAFDPFGKRLYVCNGTQNAIAVVQFEPEDNASKVVGLIPTGWFPAGIQFDARRKRLCVANTKGAVSWKSFKPGEKTKLSVNDYSGNISMIPLPSRNQLATLTKMSLENMLYPRLAEARLPARPNQPSRPVPERAGEPSVFKHVIYVIKENRTYDQVLGDMPEGNGDTNLCAFGELYTPNQHKLAREFVLLDNMYCSGMKSADGHQWTDSAMANEYVERQISSGSPRSYPNGKEQDGLDALAWASSGFIWDNALAHGKTFRNYGEWMISQVGWTDRKRKDRIHWSDFWQELQEGSSALQLRSRAGIESLRPYSPTNTVGWDLRVPDLMRAAQFIRELGQFETNGGFPELVLLFLPNDHTAGTEKQYPKPGSLVADNDLAFGQIVEALTHSRFWPETCLLAIEDDPQAGWDHVSGYRTTCYVVSPYTKRRRTIHTQYNQLSLVRTIEFILNLPPMNQMDATASPMRECFNDEPDLTPFCSVPNRVRLDDLNPDPKKVADRVLREDAIASDRLPLDEPDLCPEDLLNRILWRAMKGADVPYPEWAVKRVEDDD
jgi:DNA-binding beta-propeller fold protein YncE